MGVVQNYGTRKLPLRRAFANLSRPFAPQQNRDMGLWSGFRVKIRNKDLQEDCIKKHYLLAIRFQSCSSYIPAVRDESVPVHRVDGIGQVSVPVRTLDFWTGHWFCTHSLKSFWSCDIAERTSHFGPGLGPGQSPFANLSRTFREPFADFSSKKWNFRSFMKILWSPPVK